MLRGELAVAVAFPGERLAEPGLLVLAEVRDESEARRALEQLAGFTGRTRPRGQRIGNAEVVTVPSAPGEYAYTVTGGYLAVGSPERVRTLLERRLKPLANSPRYQTAMLELPDPTGSFAYADLGALLSYAGSELPRDEFAQAAKALTGLVLNVVAQQGTSRFSRTLLIEE